MKITRLMANNVTYGGRIDVSQYNIDFSRPAVLMIDDPTEQSTEKDEGG